jgi:hypothetical protein
MHLTFNPNLFCALAFINTAHHALFNWPLPSPRLRSTLKFSSVNYKTLQDSIPLIAFTFYLIRYRMQHFIELYWF